MRKPRLSKIAVVILLFFVFSLFFQGMAEPVFARDGPLKPDVEIFIHGENRNGGPIFNTAGEINDGLWAPGLEKSGIIRIYNDYSDRISIHNLGVRMKLLNSANNEKVTDAAVFEEYARAMELRITKGVLLVFENDVYDKDFYSMLYDSGDINRKGYELGMLDRINISKGASVDLKYTVHMSEKAGNNLQGLKAVVDFVVNSQENPYVEPPDDDEDDDDDDYDDNDNNRNDKLIEEPVDTIPDIGGHWAHDCIISLINHDVLDPDSNGSVRPEDYITRAEAAVLMARALKLEESTSISTGYVDTVPEWARGYIIATTEAKVFKGYPGKVFKASGNISREEMTAVLIRAFRNNQTSEKAMSFTDSDKIGNWARGNIAASVEEGIITGYATDNTFRPKAYITRAETFTIVCKLLGYHEEHSKKVSFIYQP